MSLELINIKGKTFSRDYTVSDTWDKFIINKSDILLIEEDNPCKDLCMLHLKGGLILIVPKWDNTHFWRTINTASLNKWVIKEEIAKAEEIIQAERDNFRAETGYGYSTFPDDYEECVKTTEEEYDKIHTLWHEHQKEIKLQESKIKCLKAELDSSPATLNDIKAAIDDLTDMIEFK